jgi:hypothetical protein
MCYKQPETASRECLHRRGAGRGCTGPELECTAGPLTRRGPPPEKNSQGGDGGRESSSTGIDLRASRATRWCSCGLELPQGGSAGPYATSLHANTLAGQLYREPLLSNAFTYVPNARALTNAGPNQHSASGLPPDHTEHALHCQRPTASSPSH